MIQDLRLWNFRTSYLSRDPSWRVIQFMNQEQKFTFSPAFSTTNQPFDMFQVRIPVSHSDLLGIHPHHFSKMGQDIFSLAHRDAATLGRRSFNRRCACQKTQRNQENDASSKQSPKENPSGQTSNVDSVSKHPLTKAEEGSLDHVDDSKERLCISLDARSYEPEEIHIRVKDGYISVEAKHEEKSEDDQSFSSHQFVRRFALPSNVKAEDITSSLSSKGALQIIAPKHEQPQAEINVPMEVAKE
ncbi:Lethal2essential for life [Caligus rogercresseyi]|uniref:Lethal2essential for life n=1 Tax=Caligus rogercresseyi TaxID=217165 RepID=A0A7T8K1T1_CALRO|nr:Lethal2essential for life [Caligus rogercresseyi]